MTTITSSKQELSMAALALGVFTAFLWGTWPVISRFSILQTLTPMDIVAIRFWVAGLILLPYLLKKGWGGLSLVQLVFLAAGGGMLYVYLALTGLSFAPSGHAGMIIPSCTMTFTFIGSWLFLGDRPKSQRILGILVIISGIIITNYFGSGAGAGSDAWIGHLFFVFAGFCWGSYTVAAKKAQLSALHLTAIVSVVSMFVYTPLYLVFGEPMILQAELSDIMIQGVFQGVIIAILALFTYTKTIELMGASRASLFVALVPGFAVLIAYPVLGEVPGIYEIMGLILITSGMVIALRSR
ncbi:MAG: DMT family transporter [Arenicella sp.]